MSKHIQTNAADETDDNFDSFFPHFVYVLRDFSLKTEVEGHIMTSDEYLEDCLNTKVFKYTIATFS